MDEVVVVLLRAAVTSGVGLREQVALQSGEAGLVGDRLAVDDPLDRLFPPVARDEACTAEVRRSEAPAAGKGNGDAFGLAFEITEKLDLYPTSAGRDQPPPAIDSSVWLGADRLERSFERPHITFHIREERDVDVDVGRAEMGRRSSAFAAGEELGHQPAEHDQVKIVGAESIEELKERILGELARSGHTARCS